MEERTIPPQVKALAQQVGMTPLDWWIHPDHITITFVEGPKKTFEIKPTEKTTIKKVMEKAEIMLPLNQGVEPAPPAASTPPSLEAATPPVKTKKGKQTP